MQERSKGAAALAETEELRADSERCWRHCRPGSQRGFSKRQVPVLLATARRVLETVGWASLQAALEPLLARDAVLAERWRVRGSCHIPTGNNRHQQRKEFLRPFPGVATKYLDSYPRWFQQVGLFREASPHSFLAPSLAPQCMRFAN